jgi:glutaredoxin
VAPHVTFYAKGGCPHCERERAVLVARGARFIEVDVVRHPEAIPELLKLTKGRRVVPVIVEGAQVTIAGDGVSEF